MECNFTIGQSVICIDDLFIDYLWKSLKMQLPKLNVKYIIRDIYIEDYADEPNTPALLLQEIRNPVFQFVDGKNHEVGFSWWRFKPLTKDKAKAEKSTFDFNSLL